MATLRCGRVFIAALFAVIAALVVAACGTPGAPSVSQVKPQVRQQPDSSSTAPVTTRAPEGALSPVVMAQFNFPCNVLATSEISGITSAGGMYKWLPGQPEQTSYGPKCTWNSADSTNYQIVLWVEYANGKTVESLAQESGTAPVQYGSVTAVDVTPADVAWSMSGRIIDLMLGSESTPDNFKQFVPLVAAHLAGIS